MDEGKPQKSRGGRPAGDGTFAIFRATPLFNAQSLAFVSARSPPILAAIAAVLPPGAPAAPPAACAELP
jgi:hypothetical protein